MKKFFKEHSKLPMYIMSSLVGNMILYSIFNWTNFEFKGLLFTALATLVGFLIGYPILKVLEIINEVEKEGYEYRKAHPIKDEPW